LTFYKSITNRQ